MTGLARAARVKLSWSLLAIVAVGALEARESGS